MFWRRSAPYPSFVNFDAPDRSSCCTKRPRTNTPLQALTLLNDPAYVEMALALAGRILNGSDQMNVRARVVYGFRLCVARHPTPEEISHLEQLYRYALDRFQRDPSAARSLIEARKIPQPSDPSELAAWFYVANILLNLDETITKG